MDTGSMGSRQFAYREQGINDSLSWKDAQRSSKERLRAKPKPNHAMVETRTL
jgi:hypothetical protein